MEHQQVIRAWLNGRPLTISTLEMGDNSKAKPNINRRWVCVFRIWIAQYWRNDEWLTIPG